MRLNRNGKRRNRMARNLPVLATALLGLIATWVAMPLAPARAEPTDEEYAVYAAILSDRWAGEGKPRFVVQSETTDAARSQDFDETIEFLKKELRDGDSHIALGNDLIESFRRVHSASVRLDPKRLDVPNAILVSSAEIDSIFRGSRPLESRWAAFRDRFRVGRAEGLVRLSRVGFSADGHQAVLSVSDSCGTLCGSGDYVFLQKRDREWRVVARILAWIS